MGPILLAECPAEAQPEPRTVSEAWWLLQRTPSGSRTGAAAWWGYFLGAGARLRTPCGIRASTTPRAIHGPVRGGCVYHHQTRETILHYPIPGVSGARRTGASYLLA